MKHTTYEAFVITIIVLDHDWVSLILVYGKEGDLLQPDCLYFYTVDHGCRNNDTMSIGLYPLCIRNVMKIYVCLYTTYNNVYN